MDWEKASPELSALLGEALAQIDHEKRSMFGMPAYFIDGNLFAGVHGRNLMVRLPPDGPGGDQRASIRAWAGSSPCPGGP